MSEDAFSMIMVGVGVLVMFLVRGIFHYREYDRRRPQCPEVFDGGWCLKKKNHLSEHHAIRSGDTDLHRGIRWTTEYAKRKED